MGARGPEPVLSRFERSLRRNSGVIVWAVGIAAGVVLGYAAGRRVERWLA